MLIYRWTLLVFDRLRCLAEVEWKIVEKIYKAEGAMKTKQNKTSKKVGQYRLGSRKSK